MSDTTESFVRVIQDGVPMDYPLPLPMLPTYREMNLIKQLTKLTIGEIIVGAGGDPDADFAVAIYAIKRADPSFGFRDAEALFDLPFGAIEIHFAEVKGDGSPEAPAPESGRDEAESGVSEDGQPS